MPQRNLQETVGRIQRKKGGDSHGTTTRESKDSLQGAPKQKNLKPPVSRRNFRSRSKSKSRSKNKETKIVRVRSDQQLNGMTAATANTIALLKEEKEEMKKEL